MDGKASLATLARESAIYGGGMVLVRGLGFLLTPLFTRLLDANEFGTLDLLQTGALLSALLLSLRLESAVLRYHGEEDLKTLFSTYLIAQLAMGVAFLVITTVAIVPVARRWHAIGSPIALATASLSVVTGLLYGHALTLLRAEREVVRASSIIAAEAALNVGLSVALVAGAGWGIPGIFASRVLADGSLAAAVLVGRRRVYGWCFSWPVLLRMLRFSAPTIPDGLLSFAAAHVGKIVLLRHASLSEVGVLAVANRLSGPLNLAFQSFRQAWLPYAFSVAKQPEARKLYASVLTMYARLAGLLAFAMVLFAREIVLLFAGAAYFEARWLLGVVVATAVIGGLPYILNIGLLLAEKTRYYGIALLMSSTITIAASIVFVPQWGMLGAPIAGLLGAIVLAGAVLFLSQRIRPMPYDVTGLAVLGGVVVGLAVIGATEVVDWPLPVRLGILAVGVACVLRTGSLRDAMRALFVRRSA